MLLIIIKLWSNEVSAKLAHSNTLFSLTTAWTQKKSFAQKMLNIWCQNKEKKTSKKQKKKNSIESNIYYYSWLLIANCIPKMCGYKYPQISSLPATFLAIIYKLYLNILFILFVYFLFYLFFIQAIWFALFVPLNKTQMHGAVHLQRIKIIFVLNIMKTTSPLSLYIIYIGVLHNTPVFNI